MSIVIVDDTQIFLLRPEVKRIVADLFKMDADECLLTDESSLYDFFPSGTRLQTKGNTLNNLYGQWEIWLRKKVWDLYGVSGISTRTTLVYLASQLKASPSVH